MQANARGYFGIGVERISKPMNVGNLFRTAHAFGAKFLFAIAPAYERHPDGPEVKRALEHDLGLSERAASEAEFERALGLSDTSEAAGQLPLFVYPDVKALQLPSGCQLIGIELVENAIPLPSFRHPHRAAYVLGPERGSLSPEMLARCAAVVQIPMSFCVNVGIAGAIVLYDRLISLGRFGERPVGFGGKPLPVPAHIHGG